MFCYCLCFFLSSRRRHTRCYRDWSSDVCSSDLGRARHSRPGAQVGLGAGRSGGGDRKSTRLNSSHGSISYAVFCLKQKNNKPASCDARLSYTVPCPLTRQKQTI